jgi:hypothetical protein
MSSAAGGLLKTARAQHAPIPVTTIPDASCFCGFLAASYIFLCTFLSLFTVYLCKDVNYLGILGGL